MTNEYAINDLSKRTLEAIYFFSILLLSRVHETHYSTLLSPQSPVLTSRRAKRLLDLETLDIKGQSRVGRDARDL